MSKQNPFRYFKTSSEAIRLAVMIYIRFPLFLSNLEDLLNEREIDVSHELRTPLNAILGFSEILKTQPFGELGDWRYSKYAFDIHDRGTHLLEIINDILDLSRTEAGQVTLREEAVHVPKIVERVLTMLRGRANEGGVTIVNDLPDELPELHADARILR